MMLHVLEWAGCVFGVLGSALLAWNTQISRYGWFAYEAANVAMILFAWQTKAYGLLAQQVVFMGTSSVGIYRAFAKR